MLVNIFANLGLIGLNIYLIMRLKNYVYLESISRKKEIVLFILLETLIGIVMLHFSSVFLNVRVDFRFLLYAILIKYLGWEITLPTILLVMIARLFYSADQSVWMPLLIGLFLIVSLQAFFSFIKKYFSDLVQLLILQVYIIAVFLIPNLFFLDGIVQVLQYSGIFLVFGLILCFITYFIYADIERVFSLPDRDHLTKLGNVRKFHKDINGLEVVKFQYSLVMVDIDYFKKYNDTYGHKIGDQILKETAAVMISLSDKQINFYRIGGEEFVAIIKNEDYVAAISLANKIEQSIKNLEIDYGEIEKIRITVSIGVTQKKLLESSSETLVRADSAMYSAKRNGRDQIIFF
ncbi:GGDEF domain-containing protein [Enterococcus sp. LJL120]